MKLERSLGRTRFRWHGLLARLQKAANFQRHHHNKVLLLPHGGDFFPALFQACTQATTSLCVEFYLIRADGTGQAFAQVLEEAARRGVEVSLIYDSIGCFDTPSSYFQRLNKAGVRCLPFNRPALSRPHWLDLRDHRKIVIIDGTTAFLGGFNVGDEYSGFGHKGTQWRDVGLRLDGPAVTALLHLFRQTWAHVGGQDLPARNAPAAGRAGDADVIIINGSPHHNRPRIRNAFRLAMAGSTGEIGIITPYFLPGPRVVRSLLRAVRRGVQVQLILPSISDVPLVQMMSRAYLKPLLAAGVRIYARQDAILHAKVMLIDHRWVMLGSANMDFRSFHRNFEINIILDSLDFGAQMRALFNQELAHSLQLTEAQAHRGMLERVVEWLLSPLSRFL